MGGFGLTNYDTTLETPQCAPRVARGRSCAGGARGSREATEADLTRRGRRRTRSRSCGTSFICHNDPVRSAPFRLRHSGGRAYRGGMSGPDARRAMTVEEYLRLDEGSSLRHEYVAGEVYAMSGV